MSPDKYERFKKFDKMEKMGEIHSTSFPQSGRHLVFGCVHVPFHDKDMLKSMLGLLSDVEFKGIHIIGDFLDMNTFSSHDRGKFTSIPQLTYTKEINEGNKVLDMIESEQDFEAKSYLWGNHEDRYWRYMKDMESAKRPLVSPTEGLNLIERGYTVLENWQTDFVMLGDHLQLHHGTYYNVHCAKNHLDKLRSSNMFVHTHRIQHYIEGNEGSYNIGFMGDKKSPAFNYAARPTKSQWQNGFAVVTLDDDGFYFVEQVTFINKHFIYGGKTY